jgi:hypothetical protein
MLSGLLARASRLERARRAGLTPRCSATASEARA